MSYVKKAVCFKELKEFYDSKSEGPFKKQNLAEAGRDEIHSIFTDGELSIFDRLNYSRSLTKLVIKSIDNQDIIKKIISFIEEYPIINYYGDFLEVLSGVINSSGVKKSDIGALGRKLCFTGSSEEEIKLGLTLLNFDNLEEIKEEIFILGLYNEYAFYVAQLLKRISGCNRIIFELAKKTRAAGKVIYTNSIDVLDKEIKEWFISEGWKDSNYQNLLWETTVIRVGFDYFFKDENINERTFISFGDILNNIFILYNYSRINSFSKIVKRYVDLFMKYSENTRSYLAFGNAYRYIIEESNIEDDYYKKVQRLYLKIDWMKVLEDAIKDESIDSPLLFQLAIEMEEDLTVDEVKFLLTRNPKDIVWYKYIEMLDETPYSNMLIDFVKSNLDLDEILCGPQDLLKDEVGEETSNHTYLLLALEALTRESAILNQDFLITCLKGDLVEIRLKAIDQLWLIKEDWNLTTYKEIREAIDYEVIGWIKNKLKFLIYESNKNLLITDITYPEESIVDGDIFLADIVMSTKIANKLSYRKELIKEGDILTVVSGLDGYKEDKVYIVTNFGVVLGELSNREGAVVKNLILGGDRVAGRIKKYDDNMDFMYISLFKKADSLMKELSDMISDKLKDYTEI